MEDKGYEWDEFKDDEEGILYNCMANQNCSEAALTSLTITERDDSDDKDGSAIQGEVLSHSYDAVTGIYTEVKQRTMKSGPYNGRVSNSLSFVYLVDSPEAERYVDFTGTWQAIETRPGCNKMAKSAYVFDDKGATVTGQEFNGACTLVDLEANLTPTYQELADMDFWWFTTNGTDNDAKATLAQLNTTVRWCDDDQPSDTCQTQKFNRWEYAPAGKNWKQGVLHRRTLASNGDVIANISFQKQ